MTGIIAAMDKEINALRARLADPVSETVSSVTFTRGKLEGLDVVCAVCGIGKVNAAVCTQTMILRYAPDRIINTGVGGALSEQLHVCDVVLASYAVQHDMDTSALGDEPGFVSTINVKRFCMDETLASELSSAMMRCGIRPLRGGIATGDRFVCATEDKQRIRSLFDCDVCEMEGGAIAHTCYMNHVPCAILRAISDGADDGAQMSYLEFAQKAADANVQVLCAYAKETAEKC